MYIICLEEAGKYRTQIYLQDSLHVRLKALAKTAGVSVSELIRRTLNNEIKSDPSGEAVAFFERLRHLTSFSEPAQGEANVATQSPEAYVSALRAKSRLFQENQNASD